MVMRWRDIFEANVLVTAVMSFGPADSQDYLCPQGLLACDEGFTFIKLPNAPNSACFILVFRYGYLHTAREKCNKLNATFPIIKSVQKLDAFVKLFRETHQRVKLADVNLGMGLLKSGYLGLSNPGNGTKFYWDDGSEFSPNPDISYVNSPSPLSAYASVSSEDKRIYWLGRPRSLTAFCEKTPNGLPRRPVFEEALNGSKTLEILEGDIINVTCSADLRSEGNLNVVFIKNTVEVLNTSDSRVTIIETSSDETDTSPCMREATAVVVVEAELSRNGMVIGCVSYFQDGLTPCTEIDPYCATLTITVKLPWVPDDSGKGEHGRGGHHGGKGGGDDEDEEMIEGKESYTVVISMTIVLVFMCVLLALFCFTWYKGEKRPELPTSAATEKGEEAASGLKASEKDVDAPLNADRDAGSSVDGKVSSVDGKVSSTGSAKRVKDENKSLSSGQRSML